MSKILNEMPASATYTPEPDEATRSYNSFQTRGKKPVYSKDIGNYIIEIYEQNDSIVGFILYTGSPIGIIRALKTHTNLPIILSVAIDEDHQGKGLGIGLYKYLIKLYGGLISDKTLSQGSYKLWEKLGSLYPNNAYVVPMNQWNDDFTKVSKVSAFTSDMIGKTGERFMICTRSSCEDMAGRNKKKIQEIWDK